MKQICILMRKRNILQNEFLLRETTTIIVCRK